MNNICVDLPFVTTYLDDLLIHSKITQEHKEHLEILSDQISTASLTLCGSKCCIGLSQVAYLGHTFTADGMSPELQLFMTGLSLQTRQLLKASWALNLITATTFITLQILWHHYTN